MKTKILIIDDSAVIRSLLTMILSQEESFEVVGEAVDPYQARDLIKRFKPDVLTLDVEMPKMHGLDFLKNLMRLNPLPVVMISSLTARGAEVTLMALELGAIDFIQKPTTDVSHALPKLSDEIISKVKNAAKARVASSPFLTAYAPKKHDHSPKKSEDFNKGIILIGASTGGVEALMEVLITLPDDLPPIVIVQHIPAKFSASFAKRLNKMCAVTVIEVTEKTTLESGHAYLAPGGFHLYLHGSVGFYYVTVSEAKKVNGHCPSVDVLFRSVAPKIAKYTLGIILTGMGHDGAKGLKYLRDNEAYTVAQDEASSVVWGMPKAAIDLGAARKILSLENISKFIASFYYR